MNNELITVTQLPIIEERLQAMSEEAKLKVQEATAMAVSEDSVKEIKAVRAALNKEFNELETARKGVKNTVMKPYNDFEARYKELITNVYRPADAELARKIASVEGAIKREKELELKRYFAELCVTEKVDWLMYEQAGINVTLSASCKSLKDQVKTFVEKVSSEISAIEAMPDSADIMAEYKCSLNMALAIKTVTDRRAAIEAEKQRMAERETRKQAEAQTVEKVEQYCAPEKPVEDDQIYSVSFTVRGTKVQLKYLKEFLKNGGYDYEC